MRGKVKLRRPAVEEVCQKNSDLRVMMLTKSVVDANSPSHSLLALNGREHLGRVLESDWSFTQRVADSEQVDESSRSKQSVKLKGFKHV